MEVQDKPRRLLLALELVALLVAAVLILVDYKLKQDLLDMFRRIEMDINHAWKLSGKERGGDSDTGWISTGPLVDNDAAMETPAGPGAPAQNGDAGNAHRRAPARRSGRNGDTGIPGAGDQVGP
jgi:hypothetical protein